MISSFVRNSIPFLFSVFSPLLPFGFLRHQNRFSPSCFLPGVARHFTVARPSFTFHASVMLFSRCRSFALDLLKRSQHSWCQPLSVRPIVRHSPDDVTCSHPASSDSPYCHCLLCLHNNFFGRCHSYFSAANLAQAVSGKYLSVSLSVPRRYSCTNFTAAFRIFFYTPSGG